MRVATMATSEEWPAETPERKAPPATLIRVGVQAPVTRATENLKVALRLRRGALDATASEAVATALDDAARAVERS